MEEQQIFKTASCLIHGELLPLPSFRIAMHHGFVFLFYFFSFPKCPVEDWVQRNSAALENGGRSAPRPILMFIRVSCVFGPDHKQNTKTGTDLSICPGLLLGLLAMTEGGGGSSPRGITDFGGPRTQFIEFCGCLSPKHRGRRCVPIRSIRALHRPLVLRDPLAAFFLWHVVCGFCQPLRQP